MASLNLRILKTEPTVKKYALRTQSAWDAMTPEEQAVYAGHYTSIQTWWDTECSTYDFVTSRSRKVLECFNDWGTTGLIEDISIVEGTGFDADLSTGYYPEIVATAGHEHNGVFDSSFFVEQATTWTAAKYDARMCIDGIQLNLKANAYGIDIYQARLNRLLVRHKSSGGQFDIAGDGVKVTSSVFASDTGTAFFRKYGGGSSLTGIADNCVFVNGIANTNSDSKLLLRNCVILANAWGQGGDYDPILSTSSNLAAYDGATNTPPGSNPVKSNISTADGVDFVSPSTGDYHLTASSVLKGAGVNLYDGTGTQTDIDGDPWPATGAWDIGADAYISNANELVLDTTLDDSTSNIDIEQVYIANINSILENVSSNINIEQVTKGSLSTTLDNIVSNISATQIVDAQIVSTLDNITTNFNAEQIISSTLDVSLENVIANFTSSQKNEGALSSILEDISSNINIEQILLAQLTTILDNVTSTILSNQIYNAELLVTLGDVNTSFIVENIYSANIDSILENITSNIIAEKIYKAEINSVLENSTANFQEGNNVSLTLDTTLESVSSNINIEQILSAQLSTIFQNISSSVNISQIYDSQISANLSDSLAAFTVETKNKALISTILENISSSISGAQIIKSNIAPTLENSIVDIQGTLISGGQLDTILDNVSSSVYLQQIILVDSSVQLQDVIANFVDESTIFAQLDTTLGDINTEFIGKLGISGNITVLLDDSYAYFTNLEVIKGETFIIDNTVYYIAKKVNGMDHIYTISKEEEYNGPII